MNTTPIALPGSHFAAALGFLLLGAGLAVGVAPDLVRGAFTLPRVVALTHLLTLGWITTAIMGALYQFLPVALGRAIASQRLAWVTLALHVAGLLLFTAGLLRARPLPIVAGATLLGGGLTLFTGNLVASLRRPAQRDLTWWALACATACLAVTIVLGLALALDLRWGFLGAAHPIARSTHLTVALGGWVLLVIVGVSHRLLPMFLLSHGAREHWAWWTVRLVATGAGALALLHHVAWVARWAPLLIGGGAVAYLSQAREFYARRHRMALDPGLRLAAAALAILALALVAGVWSRIVPGDARFGVVAVLAAVLAFALFVAAHFYKIVPFLVWNHRFGPLAGKRPLPRVADLYARRPAEAAGALLFGGALLLIMGAITASRIAATAGAAAFAAGAAALAAQMIAIARRRP